MSKESVSQEVTKSVEADQVVELTRKLVSTPSHIDYGPKESEVAYLLKDYFEGFGCSVKLQEVEENRPNIIASLPGSGGKSLMLNGHLDTVPPAGMDDPFSPRIVANKLYGRGTCDMKGAVAAVAVAVKAIATGGVKLKGDLIFAGTVAEETGSSGMDYLMKHGGLNPDFCVVGEPTALQVGLAHKGIEWFEIKTKGKPAHGSTPEEGISAISHMTRVIRRLEDELILKLKKKSHPLLGSPTINIGAIKGGDGPNIVPESCAIQVDRRYIPNESVDSVVEELQEILDKLSDEVPDLKATISRKKEISKVYHGPLEIFEDHELVKTLKSAIQKWSKEEPLPVGLNYWTDGALTSQAGIPTVIYGPGGASQAHTENEFVEVDKLVKSAKVYCQMGIEICT